MVYCCYSCWLGTSTHKEIAGVELPDEVQLVDSEQALNLNGAGIRKEFFISVYVAGKKSGDEKPQGGSIG